MDGRIFDLRNSLLANLKHDWTVEEMAALTGITLSHFRIVFRASLDMSPASFLKKIRLEKARHLLETTYDQVSQIGIDVGIPNDSHFARDFKQKYGLTPTEHRRQFQENRQKAIENGQES